MLGQNYFGILIWQINSFNQTIETNGASIRFTGPKIYRTSCLHVTFLQLKSISLKVKLRFRRAQEREKPI